MGNSDIVDIIADTLSSETRGKVMTIADQL
jgi:hypothetical protein